MAVKTKYTFKRFYSFFEGKDVFIEFEMLLHKGFDPIDECEARVDSPCQQT